MNKDSEKNMPRPPAHRDKSLSDRSGEKWLPVPGLEPYFCISNHGRVKRLQRLSRDSNGSLQVLKEMILFPAIARNYNKYTGDYRFALQQEAMVDGVDHSFQPHRMVYYCFKEQFDLSDPDIIIKVLGDGLDIRPENLVKLNRREAANILYDTGRLPSPFHDDKYILTSSKQDEDINPLRKLSSYNSEGELVKLYADILEATSDSGVPIKSIRRAARWLVCVTKGLYWRYSQEERIDTVRIKQILARPDVKTIEDAYRVLTEANGDVDTTPPSM
ncbi:hypothetical protein DYBT9275_05309 [Dyadobacter sp. CECT 9275]|uniref:NUMOD4 domain-containing protein n=1 Tax=Dyadobacter helix TaxID=2822344 RepID=A0A916JJZ5_9BACT|nr:NUMOD4 domain-containing protein [Dyadobacter sp. CECT 9275]CAG5012991.1 hypothetical protein DYBT9275_05309 [Dyadobacter sp. CECT 9275]